MMKLPFYFTLISRVQWLILNVDKAKKKITCKMISIFVMISIRFFMINILTSHKFLLSIIDSLNSERMCILSRRDNLILISHYIKYRFDFSGKLHCTCAIL